jgi:hypothetical protein
MRRVPESAVSALQPAFPLSCSFGGEVCEGAPPPLLQMRNGGSSLGSWHAFLAETPAPEWTLDHPIRNCELRNVTQIDFRIGLGSPGARTTRPLCAITSSMLRGCWLGREGEGRTHYCCRSGVPGLVDPGVPAAPSGSASLIGGSRSSAFRAFHLARRSTFLRGPCFSRGSAISPPTMGFTR